jgi:hypothetical protein
MRELGAPRLSKISDDLRGLHVEACCDFLERRRLIRERRYLSIFVFARFAAIRNDFEFGEVNGVHRLREVLFVSLTISRRYSEKVRERLGSVSFPSPL